MKITSHSGIHAFKNQQLLPIKMEEAWDFFSSPKNLEKITPKEMGFRITNEVAEKAYTGQIISYKVQIFPLIKSNWVTEITHVSENMLFIDEQRFGPYSMWHHEHHFEQKEAGVLMTDIIHFKIPFHFLGKIAFYLFVRKKLLGIFAFRAKVIDDYFSHSSPK